ncbi:MAG TPA: hypothetical protein VIH22_01485 [Cyclobacteriaceae bacterium]
MGTVVNRVPDAVAARKAGIEGYDEYLSLQRVVWIALSGEYDNLHKRHIQMLHGIDSLTMLAGADIRCSSCVVPSAAIVPLLTSIMIASP